jgi:hypothetical protein
VSRWKVLDDGFTQGGGVVWHRGDVDGRPSKDNALIPFLKMVGERWWQRLLECA